MLCARSVGGKVVPFPKELFYLTVRYSLKGKLGIPKLDSMHRRTMQRIL